MKIIQSGNNYTIYDDSIQTMDQLVPKAYSIRYQDRRGFFLEDHADIEIREDKIYGVHMEKVKKVMNTYDKFTRNLGVILSGKKGIGKSLFAKLLSNEAIKHGLPLIIVDKFYPDIAAYIESIDQEAIIMFDEFDKTFGDVTVGENQTGAQASLLSLFDGMAGGKKLFVITCNNERNLSEFLVNRPGRFHYHFRFDCPSSDEIEKYLKDKLEEKYYDEIQHVISFSDKVDLNYDCLRAIAFEINQGETFKDAIQDLNIINIGKEKYEATIYFENGMSLQSERVYMDMFDLSEQKVIHFYGSDGYYAITAKFYLSDSNYDYYKKETVILGDKISWSTYDDGCEETKKVKDSKPKCIVISKVAEKKLHYLV